jgi:hypothetical protein
MVESDSTGEDGVSITSVSINGTDVGLMAAIPRVHIGARDNVTTVTLKLVVSWLHCEDQLKESWSNLLTRWLFYERVTSQFDQGKFGKAKAKHF